MITLMNEQDIKTFIECMEESGDIWDESDVRRVYGNNTLEEALQNRKNELLWFANNIDKVINRNHI